MYHSAENGYLDIVLELRNLGVPWTLYTWYQTLAAAYNMRRRSITHNLLKDFSTCRQDDYNTEFITDALPLLMDILTHSKVFITRTCPRICLCMPCTNTQTHTHNKTHL